MVHLGQTEVIKGGLPAYLFDIGQKQGTYLDFIFLPECIDLWYCESYILITK